MPTPDARTPTDASTGWTDPSGDPAPRAASTTDGPTGRRAAGAAVASTPRVFDAEHRALSVGILLGVTLAAFEGLAVVTVAPDIADALGGLGLYGWIFSGFLLASLFGTVLAGDLADRRSPAAVLIAALTLFAAGSLLAGFAPAMGWLIAGRVLQGLGGGAIVTTFYTAVTLAYPDALRPRMIAAMSTAWVLPALVGPAAAGAVADLASWRWVFWAMPPLVLATAALTLRPFAALAPGASGRGPARGSPGDGGVRWPAALLLLAGTGAALAALNAAERTPVWAFAALPAGALAAAALARLTPPGTLRLARGLPSAVAGRGLMFAGFVAVEAFLALALTRVQGLPGWLVGVVIATGSIGWALGAWLQDRLERRGIPRSARVAAGATALGIGLALQLTALLLPAGALAVTLGGWAVAGLGIGSAHAGVTAIAFAAAEGGEEGRVSAALQLADQFTAAVATGVGGTLLALARLDEGPFAGVLDGAFAGVAGGVRLAFALGLALALAGVVAALRIAPRANERAS